MEGVRGSPSRLPADLPQEASEELRGRRLVRRRSTASSVGDDRHEIAFLLSGADARPSASPSSSPALCASLPPICLPGGSRGSGHVQSPHSEDQDSRSGTLSAAGSDDESSCRKRRREEHNDKEKRRRDKMNIRLCELKTLVPALRASGGAPNKETILARTVEHLTHLLEQMERLRQDHAEATRRGAALKGENEDLRARLLAAQSNLSAATLAAAARILNPVAAEAKAEAAVSALQLLAQAQGQPCAPATPASGALPLPPPPPPPVPKHEPGVPLPPITVPSTPATIPSSPSPSPPGNVRGTAAPWSWAAPPIRRSSNEDRGDTPVVVGCRNPDSLTWLALPPQASAPFFPFCTVVLVSSGGTPTSTGGARPPQVGLLLYAPPTDRGQAALVLPVSTSGTSDEPILVPISRVSPVTDVFAVGAQEPTLRAALLRCVGIRQGLIAEGCCKA